MPNPIAQYLKKRKYGDEVIVVSGLPRSGTSMMMKMLEAGGAAIMTDALRKADEDNPKGYYEFERVKDLEKDPDKSWVREARGKVLKVISFLLKDLPSGNFYRVIFMQRDLEEVLASQKKMLDRRGEQNATADQRMMDVYRNHLVKVKMDLPARANFDMIEVKYKWALENPRVCAEQIRRFVGRPLDVDAMVQVVDRELYRNRRDAIVQTQ